MAKTTKKEWVAPKIVKDLAKWSEKNVEWAKPSFISLIERRVNHVKFKKNLLITLDRDTDYENVGNLLNAIIPFAEQRWKPDFQFDIVIKFA